MRTRKIIGLFLLFACIGLVALPVFAGFSMAGFHAGLVLVSGLLGLVFTIA